MQKCQTWAGLAVGIWLPAGEASSHANSSGTSCCVCLQGREKKREEGESRYCLWCFSFAAGEGLSCVRLGLLVIFCRGDHIRKSSPSQLMPTVTQPLLIVSVAGTIECKPDCLSWRRVSASPLPVSPLHGKVVMESLGKGEGGACRWGFARTFPNWQRSWRISFKPSVGIEGRMGGLAVKLLLPAAL